MNAVIIAGTQSGVGKTTVTTAIMGGLKKKGFSIAPFKVGPDYIDTKFHSFITKEKSYNLDSWMMDSSSVKKIFSYHSNEKDIAVIEGVMGLFDGLGSTTEGSTAEIAKILNLPVVLVINARGIGASIAAMVKGYIDFDEDVNLGGVIFNNVSGERHYEILKEAVETNLQVKALGFLPRNDSLHLPSKHLGLVPVEELTSLEKQIDLFSDFAMNHIDLDGIVKLSEKNNLTKSDFIDNLYEVESNDKLRIAVAQDEAFHFYYEDNLEMLRKNNFNLISFSPIHDEALPENIDAVYIGGGYPESFAKDLSDNKSMLSSIKEAAVNNIPVYGECGGFMYLTREIIVSDDTYPMVGIFNCSSRMTERLQRFGYVEIQYDDISMKGHEFHHAKLENIEDDNDFNYRVTKASTGIQWQCGLKKNNVLGAFPHIHFISNKAFFKKLLNHFKG